MVEEGDKVPKFALTDSTATTVKSTNFKDDRY